MIYRVFLEDLVVDARIGVHPHEHGGTQRLAVSIAVEIAQAPPERDAIAEVYDYERLAEIARRLASDRHTRLVETLAERMAAEALAHPRARAAEVRLRKLDVLPDGASLGVAIRRQRAVAD